MTFDTWLECMYVEVNIYSFDLDKIILLLKTWPISDGSRISPRLGT